ncbi:MAG: type I-U CRISPR-associated protein Cas5/Cas6 [Rhodospirillales bacterium]|nr:MAG: type I-U CRISPR-associated protein Cas5/Cas6 [Rhodospirillales bacterium]
MTLVLEVEYLSGVAFAAIGPDSDIPDWPPQPDRVFSALVATWAARGACDREAEALRWLESQAVPQVLAPTSHSRTGATVFVPPNDPRSDKQKHAKGVLPALRSRQPRRFPATRPHEPSVRLLWSDVQPTDEMFAALQRLARDTAYVGHSASLTRCRFLIDPEVRDRGKANLPKRRVYPGRFDELRQAYDAMPRRRPLPGAPVAPPAPADPEQANLFGGRWLLLEHVSGEMPDVRACALVTKTLRDALLSGYRRLSLGDRIPVVVSGHTADGSPARAPHVAVIPLPFVGFPYADGHVMGFALVPPRDSGILEDEDLRKVLRLLAPIDEERGRRVLRLKPKAGTPRDGTFHVDLSPTFEPPAGKRSLDPALYLRPARAFASVTPIALDRHLKSDGGARQGEMASQIAAACRNSGLPEPEVIVPDKHAAFEGAPSAYPSGNSPAWTRWRLPSSLASRQLTHAVIRFSVPLAGPVMLGAGRFVGLGLCRPLDGAGG